MLKLIKKIKILINFVYYEIIKILLNSYPKRKKNENFIYYYFLMSFVIANLSAITFVLIVHGIYYICDSLSFYISSFEVFNSSINIDLEEINIKKEELEKSQKKEKFNETTPSLRLIATIIFIPFILFFIRQCSN
jgi:hypothetical protein